MEFLKRYWAQVQAQLGSLTGSQKWLIASLSVLLVMSGTLMVIWAGKPAMAPINAFAGERQGEVVGALRAAGMEVQTAGGQLLVPAERQMEALAMLEQSDLLMANTAAAFDDLVKNGNPWMSNAQNAQAYLLAKQKVLGQIVGRMSGVRTADVVLSMPEEKGFGATHVRPSASITIVMRGTDRVDKQLVEAVAGLVSGAVAEMHPQDVVVIDANRGRQFTVKSADDEIPTETLELVQHLESRYREKIERTLGYIPGVIVAVNLETDPVHSKQIEEINYEDAEPLEMEERREIEREDTQAAAEPGARSNVMLEIQTGSRSGSTERINESRTEFGKKAITRRAHIREMGHTVQQVNVSVNVPRRYFVALYRRNAPAPAPDAPDPADPQMVANQPAPSEPTDEQLGPLVEVELAKIREQVSPLIASEQTGMIAAHMIPDRDMAFAAASVAPQGLEKWIQSPMAKPVGLGLLVAMTLAIMFGMVRKATRKPELPTPEELAGLPPRLDDEDDDLLGDANADEAPMEGIELDEEEIEARRLIEQIAEMVENNPTEAAEMVNRWVRTDEY